MSRKTSIHRSTIIAVALAGLIATGSPNWSSAGAKSTGTQASKSGVSTERITKHIAFLASDKLQGRRAGTPGAEQAADYISAEFKRAGLSPLDKNSFFQKFDFV